MSLIVDSIFLNNAKTIANLSDGSKLVFSRGKFDHWCIYHVVGSSSHAIKDIEIFQKLQTYNGVVRFTLYQDFLDVFQQVTNLINYDVVEKITLTSKRYTNPTEIEFILLFLYAGMIAEENKMNAILKKHIKRLGVHQVLIERVPAAIAANYSKGKNWRELKLECEARGFYLSNNQSQLSA